MADPIPYVVAEGGSAGAAPDGAIPIALFGAGGGGGGSVDSVNGQAGDVELVIGDIPDLQSTLTTMDQRIASRASAEDLDNVNVKADDALFTANSKVTGLNGATGLWIGVEADLPAPEDRLDGVAYLTYDPEA